MIKQFNIEYNDTLYKAYRIDFKGTPLEVCDEHWVVADVRLQEALLQTMYNNPCGSPLYNDAEDIDNAIWCYLDEKDMAFDEGHDKSQLLYHICRYESELSYDIMRNVFLTQEEKREER